MMRLCCEYVDGVTIFPKLPVYLREYHDIYLENMRVKDPVNLSSKLKALILIGASSIVDRGLSVDSTF